MKKPVVALFFVTFLALPFTTAASAQTDRPVKIIKKPNVRLATCGQIYGQTTLRVTFDKSGKITETTVAESSGCSDFDDNSIDAARRIEFEPAIKDGEPASVIKTVLYRFGIYRR